MFILMTSPSIAQATPTGEILSPGNARSASFQNQSTRLSSETVLSSLRSHSTNRNVFTRIEAIFKQMLQI